MLVFAFSVLGIGGVWGWKALAPRMIQIPQDFTYREQMYAKARPMAQDYPVFGTGPGTFENVFQLYRRSTDTYWPAQLHNDWLETRITFGWVGSSLLALALLTVGLRWLSSGGILASGSFIFFIWLAFVGALIHARFDFPFQIHSIVFLFLLLCAIQFSLARNGLDQVPKQTP